MDHRQSSRRAARQGIARSRRCPREYQPHPSLGCRTESDPASKPQSRRHRRLPTSQRRATFIGGQAGGSHRGPVAISAIERRQRGSSDLSVRSQIIRALLEAVGASPARPNARPGRIDPAGLREARPAVSRATQIPDLVPPLEPADRPASQQTSSDRYRKRNGTEMIETQRTRRAQLEDRRENPSPFPLRPPRSLRFKSPLRTFRSVNRLGTAGRSVPLTASARIERPTSLRRA